MEYYLKPSALRDLKKLPKAVRKRIIGKLDFYSRSNKLSDFAEKLQDDALGDFRFHIGERAERRDCFAGARNDNKTVLQIDKDLEKG